MRSMSMAMAWEFWQRGKREFPVSLLGALLLPMLLYGVLSRVATLDSLDPDSTWQMHFAMLLVVGCVLVTTVLGSQGLPNRCYARPIATWALVGWPMLQSLVVASLLYLIVGGILNATFPVGWPLVGPALFFATMTACMQAVIWSTATGTLPQIGIASAVAAAGFFWVKWRFGGPPFSGPVTFWRVVTAGDLATLAATVAAAYGFAVAGVNRDRCGEHRLWPAVMRWFERVTTERFTARKPFANPLAAQYWSICRPGGLPMLFLILAVELCAVTICFGAFLLGYQTVGNLLEGICAQGIFCTLFWPPLFGVAISEAKGNVRLQRAFDMNAFLATRPIATRDLAACYLKAGGASIRDILILSGIAVLCLTGLLAAFGPRGEVAEFYASWLPRMFPNVRAPFTAATFGPLMAAGVLLAAWSMMGLIVSAMLAGHGQLFFALGIGLPAVSISWIAATAFFAPPLYVQYALGCAIALVAMGGVGWAHVAARRRAFVSATFAWSALAGWMGLCAAANSLWFVMHPEASRWGSIAPMMALCALPFAPFATMPLALQWNRHR